MERGWREMSPNCPRCGSSNTKFCYYNNYSLTQPRYFCKGCRRYWTKGGSLRNVPIGGGCRKSRRSRSSTLRLATSNPNHHHGLNTSRSVNIGNTFLGHGGHQRNNNELGHGPYVSSSGDLTTMVEPNPSSLTLEAPAIDLAIVYANFLSQEPKNIDSQTNIVDSTNNPSSSQGLLPINMPYMSNEINHNQIFLTEFSRPRLELEEISMQEELVGLPPLPGESLSQEHRSMPWAPSTLNDHDDQVLPNLQLSRVLPDLEPDSQLSILFNGSWSPLDLPDFETSSSSTKP